MERRTLLTGILLAVGLLIGGGLATADTEATNGFEQWTSGWSDGCFYFGDGFQYTQAACPRTHSGFDFYVPVASQWTYYHSAGIAANGQVWYVFWDSSWVIMNQDGTIASASFLPNSVSIGSSINWADPRIQALMQDPAKAAALIQMQETMSESMQIVINGM